MNLTILDILRNYDSSFYYEDDYRKKETNGVYNIEESQLDLDDILVFLNNNNLFIPLAFIIGLGIVPIGVLLTKLFKKD